MNIPKNPPKWLEKLFDFVGTQENYKVSSKELMEAVVQEWPDFLTEHKKEPKPKKQKTKFDQSKVNEYVEQMNGVPLDQVHESYQKTFSSKQRKDYQEISKALYEEIIERAKAENVSDVVTKKVDDMYQLCEELLQFGESA